MPQVELAAVARLVLVAFDNIGLDADRGGNSVRKQVGIGAQGLERDVFDPGEKIGVGDDGRLDDLGISGSQITKRGCLKVPAIFLYPSTFTPFLPPTLASTCPSKVVETNPNDSPRM